MNSMLLPEMSGLLEPALAVLAVVAPLGLAYALLRLPVRGPKKKSAAGRPTQTLSSSSGETRCGKLDP
jgi:hypothetical protein